MAPSLAESWTRVAGRARLRVRAAQGRQVPQRRPHHRRGREVLVRALPRRGAPRRSRKRSPPSRRRTRARVRFRLKRAVARLHDLLRHAATGAAGSCRRSTSRRSATRASRRRRWAPGPYKFVSFKPGVELVLEAYEQYWRKPPSVKRLVFKVIPDEATRLAALKRGEVGHRLRDARARSPRRCGARRGSRSRPTSAHATFWLYFPDQWDAEVAVARPARAPGRQPRHRPAGDQPGRDLGFVAGSPGASSPRSFEFYWQPPLTPTIPRGPSSSSPRPGYPNGFDAGDYYVRRRRRGHRRAGGQRPAAPSASGQAAAARAGGLHQGYTEKKLKNVIQGQRGAFGNAATRIEAFVVTGRHLRLRQLSRHRRALPGAGRGAGPQEARGDPASDPAAHPRAR